MRKALFFTAILLSGCATPAHKIGAAYVSPMAYSSYDCDQISAETYRVGSRLHQLGVDVDKEARGDKWAMGVGLILFWPALFMVDGDKSLQSEYARLKGEYQAIQQAGISKGCVGGQQYAGAPVQSPAAADQSQPSPTAAAPQPQPYQPDPAKRCDACGRIRVP